MPIRRLPWWAAVVVTLGGLGSLYAGAVRTGFLNDDYLFLEEARARPLLESLTDLGTLGNYYRPLSRQIYFEALTPLSGGEPLVFHLVNAALFAAALVLLGGLLRALLPPAGVMAGLLYFALIPFQRVNLTWVSCSQDLLALVFVLAAFACFRRGRDGWGALAYLAALASKEVAFPLPLVLGAWLALTRAGGTMRARLLPYALVGAVWLVVAVAVRARHPEAAAFLKWAPDHVAAAIVHGLQSLLGLDHPAGFARAMIQNGPPFVPLVLLASLALWIGRGRRAPMTAAAGAAQGPGVEAGSAQPPPDEDPGTGSAPAGALTTRGRVLFGLAWIVAFALPVIPVVHTWSSYFYTLAAVGGALLVGLACRRIDRVAWVALTTVLLWWHAGSTGQAFAVADLAWGWTSHLTTAYFKRGAALSESLATSLRRLEPDPPPRTRFFFATLPPWAGFQMGNGALIRHLYRDSTLASFFYSQFSESTAAGHPSRFLYWDGVAFVPLYGDGGGRWFQVGSDLLLMDRPAGAAHAFRRGITAGEGGADLLYWLGWAELWRGRRAAAEAAWQSFGARDEPQRYHAALVDARDALLAGDTTAARRRLFDAIRAGVGRPEAHGALGELLEPRSLKYALMEYKVAGFLNRNDLRARSRLVSGLIEVRLDEAAWRGLEALERDAGVWGADTLLRARRTLEARRPGGRAVVELNPSE